MTSLSLGAGQHQRPAPCPLPATSQGHPTHQGEEWLSPWGQREHLGLTPDSAGHLSSLTSQQAASSAHPCDTLVTPSEEQKAWTAMINWISQD